MKAIDAGGQFRSLRTVDSPAGPWIALNGRRVLLLCANNYLGLADHSRVKEAAKEALEQFGSGAGAARLVCGSHSLYDGLEARLTEFTKRESALIFGSGYLANIGVIPALAGKGDAIFSDEFNHASIIDGCRLSKAEVHIFRHNDMTHLDDLLGKNRSQGKNLIVSESLYSMEGDRAPLGKIVEIAKRHGAMTMVDEAHAFGCLGPGGRGLAAEAGSSGLPVDVVMGTFGKALGSYGAFVLCSRPVRDYLINRARSFIFDTALPPPVLAAAGAALDIIAEELWRTNQLAVNSARLRKELIELGFTIRGEDHILPVIVGAENEAVALSDLLLDQGVFVPAIRPPSVPSGTSRLRATVSAEHSEEDIRVAVDAFARSHQPVS